MQYMNANKLGESFPEVKEDLCMQIERAFCNIYRKSQQEDSQLINSGGG